MTSALRSPLHDRHVSAGARFTVFGGWEMPLQYTGILEEHRAVREAAGLFDVSHMGEIAVSGRGSEGLLQRLTMNDIEALDDGAAQYSALLTPRGTVVDDLIVYRLTRHDYLLIVNAANTRKDLRWLEEHARGDVSVSDRSAEFALLALQGPRSEEILRRLAPDLPPLRPFRHARASLLGEGARAARTGYTGEDGFEILLSPGRAAGAWEALLEAGRPAGLLPAGLGARDTLRLEAGLLLYGQDLDEETSPLEAGLERFVKIDKGDFIGREALARQRREGVSRRLVGFEMVDAGVPRHGYPVLAGGEAGGIVTSGGFAPTLGRGIGLAYLPTGAPPDLAVEIRGRRAAARRTRLPFYRRPGRRAPATLRGES
jgi:aminomethyltransferase